MSRINTNPISNVGEAAVGAKGAWGAYRFLMLRRFSQLGILALFLAGPLLGIWVVKGNLSASVTLDVLPLSDLFAFVQVLATGHWPETLAWVGLFWVILFYAVLGGRMFCGWVCPVNIVADLANWLRRRFGITSGRAPAHLRFWLLPTLLIACAVTGVTVWEWVNPVSLTHRALIFGGYTALGGVFAVFLYDLLIAPHGWCGHLCPVGASYSLLGQFNWVRISAKNSSRCNDCAECYVVCPEPHIIPIPLKGKDNASPIIKDMDCTLCGRCIDVCATNVFTFTHRFDNQRV